MHYDMFAKIAIPLLFGISGYVLWFSWAWFPFAVCLQVFATLLLIRDVWNEGKKFAQSAHIYVRMLFVLLALLYAVPIVLPEVGFDALWYHLPITEVFVHTHVLAFIPELYQSAMPRLGSLMFAPSYVVGGVFGVKIFVYIVSHLLGFPGFTRLHNNGFDQIWLHYYALRLEFPRFWMAIKFCIC